MHIKKLFFLVFLWSFISVSSQNKSTPEHLIKGKIIDLESEESLEYATVVIKNLTTNQLSGGITDVDGNFKIKVKEGVYEISFEFISFKTIIMNDIKINKPIDFGVIKLKEGRESLHEHCLVCCLGPRGDWAFRRGLLW